MFISLQILLDMTDTLLYLMSIVDMQMARGTLFALIDLNHGTEKFLESPTRLKRRGNHRHTKERRERRDIQFITTALKLVIHIQGAHHTHIHIHQLGGEIQVALQIRGSSERCFLT